MTHSPIYSRALGPFCGLKMCMLRDRHADVHWLASPPPIRRDVVSKATSSAALLGTISGERQRLRGNWYRPGAESTNGMTVSKALT